MDLANSVGRHPVDRPEEHLTDFGALVSWGLQSGAIGPLEAEEISKRARREPARARRALSRALEAREAIFEIFRAEALGKRPPARALAVLESVLPGAFARVDLTRGPDGYEPGWRGAEALDALPWPALRSALELLTSADLPLVRVCASETCDWLFMDRSRNRSRRWCDMKVCGNRHKVREHYRRTHEAG